MLAVESEQVVGMASAVEYFHPDKPGQLWINEIGVAPEFRNHGIGRKLIGRLHQEGRARKCECAWLGTEKTNLAANKCFSAVEPVEPPQPFILYEWELSLVLFK